MQLKGAVVAVTGATGFLGRYIVDALLAKDAKVVGVVRNLDRVPQLRDRIELRRADLANQEDMAAAFANVDAVVSNAALFSVGNRNWDQHMRTNVEGTRNVFLGLAEAGVRRAVHLSSIAVYDRGIGNLFGVSIREDSRQHSPDARPGFSNAYAVSKAHSEQEAWRLCREHEVALTTVRPSVIYGAFDPNFMAIMRRWLSWPIAPVPMFLGIPLVYAGDVARAIVGALETDTSANKAYNTAGETNRTIGDFVASWKRHSARTSLTIPIPVIPTSMRVDSALAKREIDFENRSFDEGIRDTLVREPNALS